MASETQWSTWELSIITHPSLSPDGERVIFPLEIRRKSAKTKSFFLEILFATDVEKYLILRDYLLISYCECLLVLQYHRQIPAFLTFEFGIVKEFYFAGKSSNSFNEYYYSGV